MAFLGLMKESDHESKVKKLKARISNLENDLKIKRDSVDALRSQVRGYQWEIDRLRRKAAVTAKNKSGCGSDEAERTFDNNYRVDTAKSVIKLNFTTENILNFARSAFIAGFKAARR